MRVGDQRGASRDHCGSRQIDADEDMAGVRGSGAKLQSHMSAGKKAGPFESGGGADGALLANAKLFHECSLPGFVDEKAARSIRGAGRFKVLLLLSATGRRHWGG